MLRRSARALVLRAAAVVVAVATTWIVAGDLTRLHRRAASLGPEQPVVVATRDLPIGSTVTRSDVAVRRAHRSLVPAGTLPSERAATGRTVAVPVLRGQYVVARTLAPARRAGLDGIVPVGMRAVRVAADGAVRPRPGAVVDVIATFGAGGSARPSTIVVAAGVVVLSTDGLGAASTSTERETVGVTVLVTPTEAESLAAAMATGVLTIALAPPEAALGRG